MQRHRKIYLWQQLATPVMGGSPARVIRHILCNGFERHSAAFHATGSLGNIEHLVGVVFATSRRGERLAIVLIEGNRFFHDLT